VPSVQRLRSDATFRQIVLDAQEETDTVEFKRELPFKKTSDKTEIAKDVSGMANGSGGVIVYGIEDREGPNRIKIAAAAKPLTPGSDAPTEPAQWIDDVLQTNVVPRPRCRIREIAAEGGGL